VARACGPESIDPIFVFKTSPDLPFSQYARGNLGIVRPSFGRKTLVIAYPEFYFESAWWCEPSEHRIRLQTRAH
jgi:hypothetical protein